MLIRRKLIEENFISDIRQKENINLVGPKSSGKTTLINELQKEDELNGIDFLNWNFGRRRPKNDQDFAKKYWELIKEKFDGEFPEQISRVNEALLKNKNDNKVEWADDLIEDIEGLLIQISTEKRIVFIFDKVDRLLLTETDLQSAYGWLAGHVDLDNNDGLKNITHVAISRKQLREIVPSDAQYSSEWVGMFPPTPHYLGAYEKNEIGEHLTKNYLNKNNEIKENQLKSFTAKINSLTGGAPVLVHKLFDIVDSVPNQHLTLSKGRFEEIKVLLTNEINSLNVLDDLTESEKETLLAVSSQMVGIDYITGGAFRKDVHSLELNGFVEKVGDDNKVKFNCGVIKPWLDSARKLSDVIKENFQIKEKYEKNISIILNYRFRQIENYNFPGSDRMLAHLKMSVEGFNSINPSVALAPIRNVEAYAQNIIWDKELETGLEVPSDWIHEIAKSKKSSSLLDYLASKGNRLDPVTLKNGMRLLGFAVGSSDWAAVHRVTKYITQPTYILLSHLKQIGNLGSHEADEDRIMKLSMQYGSTEDNPLIDVHFVYTCILAAIDLFASLNRDFSRSD